MNAYTIFIGVFVLVISLMITFLVVQRLLEELYYSIVKHQRKKKEVHKHDRTK
jgi:hypothetical protein